MQQINNLIRKIFHCLLDLPEILFLNYLIFLRKNKQRIFLVEISTTIEFFFLRPVLESIINRGDLIIIINKRSIFKELRKLCDNNFKKKVFIIDSRWVNCLFYLDIYFNASLSYDIITPKNNCPKVHFPHTITSKTKNDVFSPVIENMTDIFATGKIFIKDLELYCDEMNFKKPIFHKIGCPKSDDLFKNNNNRKEFLEKLGLNPALPVIFYAPTWNQNTSLFAWRNDIINLSARHDINLILKIHAMNYMDPTRIKVSGGVDWKDFFDKELKNKKNIYNVMNADSADFIKMSDVGITDISTIWIEFYLLHKEIIFLDIPDFFKKYQKN